MIQIYLVPAMCSRNQRQFDAYKQEQEAHLILTAMKRLEDMNEDIPAMAQEMDHIIEMIQKWGR
jgi:hypothetical protein